MGKRMKAKRLISALLVSTALSISSVSVYAEDDPVSLILRGDNEALAQVREGFKQDLRGYVSTEERVFSGDDIGADAVGRHIEEVDPDLVLLLGNKSINAYREYQKSTDKDSYPPAVMAAALYADLLVERVDNSTAVLYEIPLVTSVINFRSVLEKPIDKVGVVYREWLTDFIDQNERYAQFEAVDLVRAEVSEDGGDPVTQVNEGLEELLAKDVDMIWMINDNKLLTPKLLTSAWIPQLSKSSVPVLTGVEVLLESRFQLGTMATLPDHYSLGVQAASIALDIVDGDGSADDVDVEEPRTTERLLNMDMSKKKGIDLKEDAADSVDRIIE